MTRHRLDLLSLLPGLVFVGVALIDLTDAWARDWGEWVAPTVLTASGLVVLLVLALSGRDVDAGTVPAADASSPASGAVPAADASSSSARPSAPDPGSEDG